jgi:uncharacterized membrane protein
MAALVLAGRITYISPFRSLVNESINDTISRLHLPLSIYGLATFAVPLLTAVQPELLWLVFRRIGALFVLAPAYRLRTL